MTALQIILLVAAVMAAVSLAAILAWLVRGAWLTARERRLASRKGLYRELVTGLAARERELLEPALHRLETVRDVEALEALLEEQARRSTDRPAWLLDTYDRLGLVQKYVRRLRTSRSWRERAFAAELLGRVGNATAVPALLETVRATRTEDADVREIALRALARIGDARAINSLVVAMRESEPWLTPRIADILVRHGDAVVEPMIQFLEEPGGHPARAWAANVLGELGAARGYGALARALEDPDDEVRGKAARALGTLGDRRAVARLLDRLMADPAPFVRARIAAALGRYDAPEVVDRLVRGLGDRAWWVRMRSVEALEQIGAPAEGALLAALEDSDPEIRLRAAMGLERLGVPARLTAMIEAGDASADVLDTFARFGTAGARELLSEQLRHGSAAVRGAAVEAIRRAARHDVAGELVATAGADPSPDVRASALDALRELGVRQAVPVALDRLGDGDPRVREAAVALVGQLGGRETAGELRRRTGDGTPTVRAAIATALGLLHAPESRPELGAMLADPAPEVRAAAARALGRTGDRAAIPALLAAAGAGDGALRDAVADAIPRLDPSATPALLAELRRLNDGSARTTAIRALGRTGTAEAMPLLEGALADPDPAVRAAAADGLARSGRAEAAAALARLLTGDPERSVRERAALAVGLLRAEGGDAALLAACQREVAPEVRAAAVMALGAWDQESVVARLLEMSDEAEVRQILETRLREDAEYRLLAQRMRGSRRAELRALAATSRAGMEQSLAEGTRGALDPRARVRLIAGLRAFQGDRSRGALRQMLHGDPAPDVRVAALAALGDFVDAAELEEVAGRALTDPDRRVRLVAAQLIRRLPAERGVPLLLRALRGEDDPGVLQVAGESVEADADAFAVIALEAAEQGEDLAVIARLARHTRHPSVAGLVPSLAAHVQPEVRAAASDLLRARPELADDSALSGLLADPVAEVRRAAIRAATAARRPELAAPLVRDPDGTVRVTAVVAALLGGADLALPADLPRAHLADEARLATDIDALRVLARTHPDASRRAGAAVLLALTDEASARDVAAQDPSEAVRARIQRALGEA